MKKYKETVNLKIVRYSTTNKSEMFLYDKEKDIFIGFGPKYKNSGLGKKGSCKDEQKIKQNQALAANRAKSKIKKLIIENGLKYHCVTTYKDSEKNRNNTLKTSYRDMVLYDNKLFIKKLSYHLKNKVGYIAVPEYQTDRFRKYGFKFLHMHIAVSDIIDERLFWSCWNGLKCMECDNYLVKETDFKCNDCSCFNGVTSVKIEDMDLFKIANYFSKYFSKGFEEKDLNQRTFNQKRYLNSFDLKVPQVIDARLSDGVFKKYILPNCEYIKSMGKFNNVGSRIIIDNEFIEKYIYGNRHN
jgi:hypothetical protein